MRSIVKYFLVLLLLVFVFLGETHAQSAWVCWIKREIFNPKGVEIRWELKEAFPNHDQCIQYSKALAKYYKEVGGEFGEATLLGETAIGVKYKEKVKEYDGDTGMLMEFKCFPESIDPRK